MAFEGRRASRTLPADSSHARDLLPAIEELALELTGAATPRAALGTLEHLYVGVGPGSYTGLRVGIATALGLALATEALLRGVPSFEALAYAELEQGEEGHVAWNARSGRFYLARYARTTDDVRALVEPHLVRAKELRAALREPLAILGDATVAEAAELDAATRARVRADARPHADALLALGPQRIAAHGPHADDEIEPLYLREFGG